MRAHTHAQLRELIHEVPGHKINTQKPAPVLHTRQGNSKHKTKNTIPLTIASQE